MDFQQFVTEYFSDKVDRNPSSLANDNMQELLDLSRRQDLDSRQGQLNESEDSEEITEVDAPPVESASPAQMQEPATDSAFKSIPLTDESEFLETGLVETSQQVEHEVEYKPIPLTDESEFLETGPVETSQQVEREVEYKPTPLADESEFLETGLVETSQQVEHEVEYKPTPLADESEFLETGPVEFKTSQQVEREVEYHEQLEARKSALADEDIIPAELTQLPDAEEGLSIEGISIKHESEILGAEDVDFDLIAALSTVEKDLMGEGKHIEFNPQDYDIPELIAIPDDINKEMNAVPDALNLDGLRLTELGRRT